LPRKVAWEMLRIMHDPLCGGVSRYADAGRPVAQAFRIACKTLCGARIKVDKKRQCILLHWDHRAWCLLRFEKDLAGERRPERAAGCQLALLPETKKPLGKEIAFFERKGEIIPSARRFVHPNPWKTCREDYLPLDALFGVNRGRHSRGN